MECARVILGDELAQNCGVRSGVLEDPRLESVTASSGNEALGFLLETDFLTHMSHEIRNPLVSAAQNSRGNGLGLALSKRVIQARGGDLRLKESRSAEGSTVEASIPVEIVAPGSALTPVLSPPPEESDFGAPVRVLLAGDNDDNLEVVSHVLGRYGASVERVSSGTPVIQEALRHHCGNVAMTGRAPVHEKEECLASGGSDSLPQRLKANLTLPAEGRAGQHPWRNDAEHPPR